MMYDDSNMDVEEAEANLKLAGMPRKSFVKQGTLRSEMTEIDHMDFEHSSDDYEEDVNPPWVDQIKLRHEMDWLDLIKSEV